MTVVAGGHVMTPDGLVVADVVIEAGHIAAIGGSVDHGVHTVVSAAGLLVVPGFIDLQINGGFGHDFTSEPATIWEVGARLPESGVTAFLPTIITSPRATVSKAREVLALGPPAGYLGAVPLGLHLEGPMLSSERLGTHDPADLQLPRPEVIEGWSPKGNVRLVTLAPELEGALPIIETLTERGVVVSLGHSDASYDQAIEAFGRGAAFGTHLYNAMSPFHHREPGLVGALLTESSVSVGLIVDDTHLDAAAVKIAWDAKKPDHLVLVTDAMAAMGMAKGDFDIGTVAVNVDESGPRNLAGNLAGSTLRLDQAIRNLISQTRCSRPEAIGAATANPARVLGDRVRGTLEVGARGDVVLIDSGVNVQATLVAGDVVYAAPDINLKRS